MRCLVPTQQITKDWLAVYICEIYKLRKQGARHKLPILFIRGLCSCWLLPVRINASTIRIWLKSAALINAVQPPRSVASKLALLVRRTLTKNPSPVFRGNSCKTNGSIQTIGQKSYLLKRLQAEFTPVNVFTKIGWAQLEMGKHPVNLLYTISYFWYWGEWSDSELWTSTAKNLWVHGSLKLLPWFYICFKLAKQGQLASITLSMKQYLRSRARDCRYLTVFLASQRLICV